MSGTSPVILILGAGPNIGQGIARTFAAKGYKVALASRSLQEADSTPEQLNIKSDFANTDDVVHAFTRTKKELGVPSVVVYNAASLTPSPPNDPFAIPLAGFNRDMNINTTSAFVAAQQAVLGFADLPADAAKSFFYTGNILNVAILSSFMDAGAGKSAAAHMMKAAAAAYEDRGYKFYYIDERKADGGPIFKVSGEAHGSLLWELAQAKTQGPWLQTFVKGAGYKDFGPYRL
ncbi:NAD(P)-binding protein [Coniochaeta ligniaria NRRL 30616]|uniref:NAD(P)-binding protein n=1 Tax=Coniochaeta ligniaria NRRL 30616 TaxID=1408157 RepID=A0A1J7ICR2_9PEZI|nr:NAD(P)-binding protein [Coniochaeta ligniaria NRRL 30616]